MSICKASRFDRKPLLIALAAVAIACPPAPHAGDEIAVVEESAVIVWDAATKTAHFIRRAVFHGKGRDFGFLSGGRWFESSRHSQFPVSYTALMQLTRAEVDAMLRHADEVRTKLRRATRELQRFGKDVLAAREVSRTDSESATDADRSR